MPNSLANLFGGELKQQWLMQMVEKIKIVFLVSLSCLLLSSCANPNRMRYEDLRFYRVDCSKKKEQWMFLESQRVTQWEMLDASLISNGVGGTILSGMDGTYRTKDAIRRREYQSILSSLKNDLRNCPSEGG